jgi:hypothetical protein
MANDYFNFTSQIARFTTASANRLNAILKSIETAFDKLPAPTELSQGSRNYSVATLAGSAYSATVPFTLTSYSPGLTVTLLTDQQNSGSATLNLNGVGAATIRRFDGSNLVQGDVRAASLNTFTYEGTSFRLVSMHGGSEGIATQAATSATASATSAATSATNAATSATQAAASATTATSAATQSSAILSSSRFGIKNILINNLFWVNQRTPGVFSGTVPAGTAKFIRDRWLANPGVTWSISNSTLSSTGGAVFQFVQGRNVPLAGKYTLSWTGTAQAYVHPISSLTTTIPVTNGGSFDLPGFQNCTVVFHSGTVYLPQLEFGTVKTEPEIRSIDYEKDICAQYYQKSYMHDVALGSLLAFGPHVGHASTVRYFYHSMVHLPQRMRSVPVVTLYSHNQGQVGKVDFAATTPVSAMATFIGEHSFFVESQTNGFTPGGFYYFHWAADAEL